MKFIDDVKIEVTAGKGGDGCLSFRREKFIPRGGPDGGNGGDGASIYITPDLSINTLIDFRYKRIFKAPNGQPGQGRDRVGSKGKDIEISVPLGTVIHDLPTEDILGEITSGTDRVLVAKGGGHGLGNACFKSSTNRAPRKITYGKKGETRNLRLELKLLADVGLLGLPNAGKSSLIRQISAARPKVADYPFTTQHPELGVVRIESDRSFVVADVPGIIEGAANGLGLGLSFLKHLSRTRLLLHLVDIKPPGSDVVRDAETIKRELQTYGDGLAGRERWLVINKIDLVAGDNRDRLIHEFITRFRWTGKTFIISAVTGEGCNRLCQNIMGYLEEYGELA